MLTTDEISAGNLRLVANKLKASDQETLFTAMRLYLKNRIAAFPSLAARIAAVTDNNESKTAAKLAAVLIKLEDTGFGVAELAGGKAGLKFRESDETTYQIRFALALLGYDLPELFSGNVTTGDENVGGADADGSASVPVRFSW